MTDTVERGALTRAQLLSAYRTMRAIREPEERVHAEFATGEIPGFVHLYAGEEASAVGVCSNLDDRDTIASTHRGHGHCIAKGVDVSEMMAEIYGRKTGSCHGKGGSMHIADLSKGMLGANGIVGGGPPLICGTALAAKIKGTGGVGVAFFGDGASNQGTTLEAMNLPRCGICRPSSSPRTTVTPRPRPAPGQWPATTSPTAPPGSACPASSSTDSTSSRCTRRRARRSPAPGKAAARRSWR